MIINHTGLVILYTNVYSFHHSKTNNKRRIKLYQLRIAPILEHLLHNLLKKLTTKRITSELLSYITNTPNIATKIMYTYHQGLSCITSLWKVWMHHVILHTTSMQGTSGLITSLLKKILNLLNRTHTLTSKNKWRI